MCEYTKIHTRVPARPLDSPLKDFATAIRNFEVYSVFS